ncbi:Ger(x)C family spore germination protein [Sporosarcina sp. USHLN248]|uniref:Ger(x)C family spore germination protein n=1 Tax=Sporosarcina sp. USHLN248 TaxID=3081300 RepID=UPI003016BECC
MSKKPKIIKSFISISTIISLLLLTGCAFKDIDKRMFVVGIGIDPSEKIENGFKVTLKLAKPVGNVKEATEPTYVYLSHDSESVAEAIRSMETHIDKVVDFAHNRIIMINKDLLSKDLDTFMDFFTRRGDIQLISYVAVAESTAEEIITFEPVAETPASIALSNYFDNTGTESPYVITTFLFEFRREVLGKGKDTILPIVEIDENGTEFVIHKSIILKRNTQPVELNSVETKYFNSLMNKARGFSYKIKEDGLILILNIDTVKMKYNIILDEGVPPRIDMTITKFGVIGESNKRLSLKHLKKYDEISAIEMKKKVMELLTKLQENDVDPFGFGLRYRATRLSYEGMIEEWDRIYPEIEFNVTLKVDLKSTGAIE